MYLEYPIFYVIKKDFNYFLFFGLKILSIIFYYIARLIRRYPNHIFLDKRS